MAQLVPFLAGAVRGFLHQPVHPLDDGLVLTHGAGGNCQSPLLVAVADAFADAGVWVLRYDLPFRQQRPFGPPRPAAAAADREGLRQAVHELRAIAPGRIVLGGHSYGGRQASMAVAEDPKLADALILLSYPLHPPKKPSELRTGHFPHLRTPAVFVHGTADPFGAVEELQAALALIPASTELVPIDRAGHDLLKGRFDIAKLIVEPFKVFTNRSSVREPA
jgi:predicted alpha/beta-hydrolase family hydrolase